MTTIVRKDGTPFVMHAYRELLSQKKQSQIVQEVQFLAARQGQYVKLFQKAHGQCEAVFATQPGYLFAESVWHHFNQPKNLIYCEALPDSAHILLVVVRASTICMDLRMLGTNLQSKLLPLMTEDLRYRIVTVGSVPLRKAESFGTFRFPKDLIESFETLEEPLFPHLPAQKAFQLQPLTEALKPKHLNKAFTTSAFISLVLVLMFGVWWKLTPEQTQFGNPYVYYSQVLSSPAPDQALIEIVNQMRELYFLPGWRATKLTFNGKTTVIDLKANGGEMRFLREWANRRGYQLQLSSLGPELIFRSDLSVRDEPKEVYPLEPMVTQLVDQLSQLFDHQGVQLGATTPHGAIQESQIFVQMNDVSPATLEWVSRQLRGLPVKITSVMVNLDSGLMSGTIQLSVLGSSDPTSGRNEE